MESSSVFSVGVVGKDLYVEFINAYPNVRVSLYKYPGKAYHLAALIIADSIGEYVADQIKPEAKIKGRDYVQLR